MSSAELPKAYDPSGIEVSRYAEWEKRGYFGMPAADSRKPFTIVIPPPNVTGSLHMGHALDNTLQDILIRYKRMDGFAALWIPGTDHAGIATQNVVERELAKEKLTRQALGREAFVERVWKWKEESGGKIVHQLRRLGASCDWSRERFTMDPGLSRAVRTVFVTLYREGLIYRSSYLISWCPRCQTALSDLEVDHHDVDGQLTYFHYETSDGKKISVATTRPETMLGDTAVAVHPDDVRYRSLVGKKLKHPFVEREFSVIADETVDPKFGTGAVKVTPAHDPNDYAIGERFKLPMITILDEMGLMNAEAGPFKGLDRFAARKKVIQELKNSGLFERQEPHRHAVGHCQRCRTVVEPRISEQWFVKVAPLAKPAIDAVTSGETRFIPENWTKTYLHWMENLRDWCISRQLWWGHQIPVWYCGDCNHRTVPLDDPTACEKCGSAKITRDPDVLDTWFSSALWAFSTLGWPEKTKDLGKFYPTSVLVTGFDIIFFWVARMMMMSLKFMGDVPFKIVHIHALVRDEKGQKMSKSKGNVVDPLQIMEKYGTDSFRFALASFAAQGRDILLSEKRIEGYRNFINKYWNAVRFAMGTLGDNDVDLSIEPTSFPDRWIRTRLDQLISEVRQGIDEMRFNDAADAIYRFMWHEFCDWYLELIKPHFSLEGNPQEMISSRATLLFTLDTLTRLLHPFCPFVTEEVWQKLPLKRPTDTLMLAPYPRPSGFGDSDSTGVFEVLRDAVDGLRHIRSENRVIPSKKIECFAFATDNVGKNTLSLLAPHFRYLQTLAGVATVITTAKDKPKASALSVSRNVEWVVPLRGLIDVTAERERLTKERDKAEGDRAFLEKRLADPKYRAGAPSELIARDEAKLADARLRLEKITQSLTQLEES